MKKRVFLIYTIVAISLLFVICAQAAENPFLGLWVDTDLYPDADYAYVSAIVLRKNGRAFWIADKFYDFSDEPVPDTRIYAWKTEGNKIILSDLETGKEFWTLYLFVSDHLYLSFDEKGKSERYVHVPDFTLGK